MGSFRRHILSRFIALLCLTAWAAVVVPHHHHGDNRAACFNVLHCLAAGSGQQQGGCCDHGHDHDQPAGECGDHDHETPGDGCAITQITSPAPRTDEIRNWTAPLPVDVPALHVAALSCPECREGYLDVLYSLHLKKVPDSGPLHPSVIVRTLPVRGPSVQA